MIVASSSQAPPPSPTRGKSPLTVKDISKRLDLEALYEARQACSTCVNGKPESPDISENSVNVPSSLDSERGGDSRPSSAALEHEAAEEKMSMSSDGAEEDILMEPLPKDILLEQPNPDGTEFTSLDDEPESEPTVTSASGYFQAAVTSSIRHPESIMKSSSSVESEHKPRKATKVRFDLPTSTSEPNVGGGDDAPAFFITEDSPDPNSTEAGDVQDKHISEASTDCECAPEQFAGDAAAPDPRKNFLNPFQTDRPAAQSFPDVLCSNTPSKDIDTESVTSYEATPYITGVDIKPKLSSENANGGNT